MEVIRVQFDSSIKSLQNSRGKKINSGDTVTLKVTGKRGNNWTGLISERKITFSSTLNLKIGQLVKTSASWSGSTLILSLVNEDQVNYSRTLTSLNLQDNVLNRAILDQFKFLQIPFDSRIFNIVQSQLKNIKIKNKKIIQLMLIFTGKNVEYSIKDAEQLIAFLFSNEDSELNERQKALLTLFNHIPDKNYHWIFTPFSSNSVSGRIGLRYSFLLKKYDYAFFLFNSPKDSDRGKIIFTINEHRIKPVLSVFAEKGAYTDTFRMELAGLFEKLSNKEIKCDDTIHSAEEFLLTLNELSEKSIDEFA